MGMTIEEFAKHLVKAPSSVLRWETDKGNPTRLTKRLIPDLLEDYEKRRNGLRAPRG